MRAPDFRRFQAMWGLLLAFALAAPAAARGDSATAEFDQAAPGSPVVPILSRTPSRVAAAPAEPAPASARRSDVWVSFSPADLPRLAAAGFPVNAPTAQSERAAVFHIPASILPRLSEFMHENFHRCGGFFAHATAEEARADLSAAPAAAAEAYTIDQEAWAKPLMTKVQESELRSTIETLAAYNNRFYTAQTGVDAAHWLQGRWQSLAEKLPGAGAQLVTHQDWDQPSVVLTIPGSEKPDEIVVLGGHLDSINLSGGAEARAPGADDNASGIAVLTEAIRILAAAGFRPRRTVQFMGYAAEEVGLRGSQDIARRYAQAGKKVVGVIQYDMTNFKGSDREIYLLSDNVDPDLSAFLGRLIDSYVGVPWSTIECGYACSDHASWSRQGYPASCAFESTMDGMNQNIHTDQDTLANSGGDAAHSVSFAKLAVAFAAEVAKASAAGTFSSAAALGAMSAPRAGAPGFRTAGAR